MDAANRVYACVCLFSTVLFELVSLWTWSSPIGWPLCSGGPPVSVPRPLFPSVLEIHILYLPSRLPTHNYIHFCTFENAHKN